MSFFKTYLDVVHVTLGGVGTPWFGQKHEVSWVGRVSGIEGIGEKGDEGEEREGIQSRKAKLEVEQKLRDLSQRRDIWPGHLHLRFGRWNT